MEVRIDHALDRAEVERRLARLCDRHDVRLTADADGSGGTIVKTTPVGPAEARYRIEDSAVLVEVTARPAFLPEGMVRRAVEDALRSALEG